MNIVELAGIEATKAVLDDIVNMCPWLSIVMVRDIEHYDDDGGSKTFFEICARDSDTIMDCDATKTLRIATILEDEKISAIVVFDKKDYTLYSGHIGFLEYDEEIGKIFFGALEKEYGECVLTTC